MGARPIPFDEGEASAWEELAGASPMFLNVAREQPKGFRTRPGIATWDDFPASFPSTTNVVAMTPFRGDLIYVTDDGLGTRKVYVWRDDGSVTDLSTLGTSAQVAGSESITMAAGRTYVIITGGAAPQLVDSGLTCRRLGGGPPIARDVALSSQFVALVRADDTGIFAWDFPGETGIETWDDLLDFREAEARPDPLVGCESTARELWMFGEETTQIFIPDPTEIFAPGPTLEVGCGAKRSIVRRDYDMYWLDDRQRFVLSNGRELPPENILSDRGISTTIERLSVLSDCFGFRCKIGNHDFLVQSFPTDGRTFAWDMITGSWSEWRGWDSRWTGFAATSYLWWPERKLHLVGLSNGQIATLSLDAHDDLGAPILWTARTGFIRGESAESRRTHAVDTRYRFRRGESGPDSTVNIRWRDDLGAFCEPLSESLGATSDRNPLISVSPAGEPYEQRQYELSGSAADAYALADATEITELAE